MTQEAIALRTTGGSYPGLAVVQDVNKALATIATDFAGSDDPAALAGPYMTWADTGTGRRRMRNAANSAWIDIGGLTDPSATELLIGLMAIASTAEALALTSDTKALTPKKLADAFTGAAQLLSGNGRQRFPGGLILQWGSSTGTGSSVVFPQAFGEAPYSVTVTPRNSGGPQAGYVYGAEAVNISDASFSPYTYAIEMATGVTVAAAKNCSWKAIGKV